MPQRSLETLTVLSPVTEMVGVATPAVSEPHLLVGGCGHTYTLGVVTGGMLERIAGGVLLRTAAERRHPCQQSAVDGERGASDRMTTPRSTARPLRLQPPRAGRFAGWEANWRPVLGPVARRVPIPR